MRAWLLLLACALLGAAPADPPLPAPDRLRAQAVAYAEAQATGREGRYAFKVLNVGLLPKVAKGELSFEPSHLSRAELSGPFYATFNVLAEGRRIGLVRVDLEGRWSGQLLRFRAAQPRKALLTEELLETFEFEGAPPPGAVRVLPAGQRLRNPVTAGRILLQADLEPVPLVNMGDPVRLEIVDGDLAVVVEAVARSGGAEGAKVRLELPSSHKILQAVVTGPGAARLERPRAK